MKSKKKKSIDASCLILGFTGSLGSGCTFLSEGIANALQNQGHYYRLSDHLNDLADERGLPKTVYNLQNLGNKLRIKNVAALVMACLEKIEQNIKRSNFTKDENAVILVDGIKNTGEVKYLKHFPNFYLISVHADREIREGRLLIPVFLR